MGFAAAYKQLLETSGKRCSAERRRKLRGGLGFAEKTFLKNVWWPLIGDFNHLYPEYEVADYSGASRFLDFAYLRGDIKLAIEIDGFASHAQNVDRRRFAYRLHRQNMLTLDGWAILRFAFDDVKERPRGCQRTIQQYIGSRFATDLDGERDPPRVTAIDRELVRLARSLPGSLTPKDVRQHLSVARPTAYRYIQRLVERGWLVPASGTKRIRRYKLAEFVRRLGV